MFLQRLEQRFKRPRREIAFPRVAPKSGAGVFGVRDAVHSTTAKRTPAFGVGARHVIKVDVSVGYVKDALPVGGSWRRLQRSDGRLGRRSGNLG